MGDKEYHYDPIMGLLCKISGHEYLAYDFGTDKCLRCNKERYHAASDLSKLNLLPGALEYLEKWEE